MLAKDIRWAKLTPFMPSRLSCIIGLRFTLRWLEAKIFKEIL